MVIYEPSEIQVFTPVFPRFFYLFLLRFVLPLINSENMPFRNKFINMLKLYIDIGSEGIRMEGLVKNQHYIPQCILTRFSNFYGREIYIRASRYREESVREIFFEN